MQNIIIPYKQEFEKLNNGCLSTRLEYELSMWPELVPNDKYTVNSYEYWMLDNVLDTIKIQNKSKYQNPITLGIAFMDHTPKELNPKNPNNRLELMKRHMYIPDNRHHIEMTRYACWTLMKEIETNTTFFQEYFINPNASLLDVYKISTSTARIPLRADLAKLNTQINGILHSVGADDNLHFAHFNREKYESFFGDKTKIKNHHLLPNVNTPKLDTFAKPSNTHLADYMNAQLLIAYTKALQRIIERWETLDRPYRNYTNLRDIMHNSMKRARNNFINEYESTPEKNLSPYGIKAVEHFRNMRELNFAKKYIQSHLR